MCFSRAGTARRKKSFSVRRSQPRSCVRGSLLNDLRRPWGGPPVIRWTVARDNPESDVSKENQRLREALRQCRELLEKTENLLDSARRSGGPKKS